MSQISAAELFIDRCRSLEEAKRLPIVMVEDPTLQYSDEIAAQFQEKNVFVLKLNSDSKSMVDSDRNLGLFLNGFRNFPLGKKPQQVVVIDARKDVDNTVVLLESLLSTLRSEQVLVFISVSGEVSLGVQGVTVLSTVLA